MKKDTTEKESKEVLSKTISGFVTWFNKLPNGKRELATSLLIANSTDESLKRIRKILKNAKKIKV